MTLRERYALEFAKILFQNDLVRATKVDELSRAKDEDPKEEDAIISEFYITACVAARMADDLSVALKNESPGHAYAHDDNIDYSAALPGIKKERMEECASDVAAAMDAANRT